MRISLLNSYLSKWGDFRRGDNFFASEEITIPVKYSRGIINNYFNGCNFLLAISLLEKLVGSVEEGIYSRMK